MRRRHQSGSRDARSNPLPTACRPRQMEERHQETQQGCNFEPYQPSPRPLTQRARSKTWGSTRIVVLTGCQLLRRSP